MWKKQFSLENALVKLIESYVMPEVVSTSRSGLHESIQQPQAGGQQVFGLGKVGAAYERIDFTLGYLLERIQKLRSSFGQIRHLYCPPRHRGL